MKRSEKPPKDEEPKLKPRPRFYGGMIPIDQLPADHPERRGKTTGPGGKPPQKGTGEDAVE